ncbi:hypothetical protein [Neptunicella marina]|uniref:Uncharacterized protein n=1 Tax=Neptunicella marina TaxID=2125989 RepID=A0A8J6LVJ9_9ALTE|nr:hypothetical protein [Neptunicella marina]MBC3764634.1 hypothetical protein [Neptunicella marina]
MNIDSGINPYTALYRSKTSASSANVNPSNNHSPLVNLDAKEVEVKNIKATQELQGLKVDIQNDTDLGTQEKQLLLSKLEEQLMAQYVKSSSEKEQPVKDNVSANNLNVNKLHQAYQTNHKQQLSSFSGLA